MNLNNLSIPTYRWRFRHGAILLLGWSPGVRYPFRPSGIDFYSDR